MTKRTLPLRSLSQTPREQLGYKKFRKFVYTTNSHQKLMERERRWDKQRSGVDNFIKQTVIETNRDCETFKQEKLMNFERKLKSLEVRRILKFSRFRFVDVFSFRYRLPASFSS